MQETQVTKQALDEIESRHTEIKRLERSIVELHEMFTYLAMEVEAQGELVNNIENYISNSVNYVEKAADNMATAAGQSEEGEKEESLCDYLHFGPGDHTHRHHRGCRNDLVTSTSSLLPKS
ncbi:syntaxin-4-like [Scyliorhinus canicula]|uniref:syntaxin-4-like n=1 Tax=Scyliorhinus canicula TaxID=7830 RepID=UPI0018F4644F|nr:syntaxin-4-like [Scyliorhinus canicula]